MEGALSKTFPRVVSLKLAFLRYQDVRRHSRGMGEMMIGRGRQWDDSAGHTRGVNREAGSDLSRRKSV